MSPRTSLRTRYTKKDFAKEIGVTRKAIDRIEKFVDKKQNLAQDSAIQPYQPKIDFSSHFQAICSFIVTRKGNPFFDGTALLDDAIEWSKEKQTWLDNYPNIRQLLIDCHIDIRAQAVRDAIGNWKSQQTNHIRGFQGPNGKTPCKRCRDLYSNGFMVPIPKPAISLKRSNAGRSHMRIFTGCYSDFGLISFGRMHDQVIRWFKGAFPHPSTYQNILVKFNVKTNEYFLCIPYANQLTDCQPIKLDNLVVAVFDPGTKPRHSVYFTNGKASQIGIGTEQIRRRDSSPSLSQAKAYPKPTSEMPQRQGQTIQKEETQETRI
jgi:hypothetical protein